MIVIHLIELGINKSVGIARKAFQDWRETSVTKRSQYLFDLKQGLEECHESMERATVERGNTNTDLIFPRVYIPNIEIL